MINSNNLSAILGQKLFPKEIYCGKMALKILDSYQGDKFILASSSGIKNLNLKFDYLPYYGEPTEKKLHEIFKKIKKKPAYIFGIGGGSVMDMAKLVRQKLGSKLVLIPTNFGSGSEASQYAVITKNNIKSACFGEDLVADTVFLVPELLKTLTQKQMFYCLADAVAHILESNDSRRANFVSKQTAKLALRNLLEGMGKDNLEKLQWGGFLAGLAQSWTGTGEVHQQAHILGLKMGLSHSQAVWHFLKKSKYKNLKIVKKLLAYEKLY